VQESQISQGSSFGRNALDAKFCPICKNKNDREAIVCIHCGAALEADFTDAAGTTRTTETRTKGAKEFGELPINEESVPAGEIAIYVEGTSNYVFLYSDDEFVIGRKTEETSKAFLDLSKLGGYHLGLSRQHVMIRRIEHGYEVIDLSSSNGTWLNDKRLTPYKHYPLASGSQLRLARMRFLVLYRPVVPSK